MNRQDLGRAVATGAAFLWTATLPAIPAAQGAPEEPQGGGSSTLLQNGSSLVEETVSMNGGALTLQLPKEWKRVREAGKKRGGSAEWTKLNGKHRIRVGTFRLSPMRRLFADLPANDLEAGYAMLLKAIWGGYHRPLEESKTEVSYPLGGEASAPKGSRRAIEAAIISGDLPLELPVWMRPMKSYEGDPTIYGGVPRAIVRTAPKGQMLWSRMQVTVQGGSVFFLEAVVDASGFRLAGKDGKPDSDLLRAERMLKEDSEEVFRSFSRNDFATVALKKAPGK